MKPCIRNIPKFKKGCPENTACPAWIATLGSLHPKVINKCADLVVVDLLWDLNCNTIGVEQATESFRNNMHKATGSMLQLVANEVQKRKELA
jgi:hypothetical protein